MKHKLLKMASIALFGLTLLQAAFAQVMIKNYIWDEISSEGNNWTLNSSTCATGEQGCEGGCEWTHTYINNCNVDSKMSCAGGSQIEIVAGYCDGNFLGFCSCEHH